MEASLLILCSSRGKNGAREGPELLQGRVGYGSTRRLRRDFLHHCSGNRQTLGSLVLGVIQRFQV